MDGILVVDKPIGPTSTDVVRRLKHLGTDRSAGHIGTLDPLASGVLPVCLGDGTKLAAFLGEVDKSYEGVVRLGIETDSYDSQGKEVARVDPVTVLLPALEAAVQSFSGELWQTPPMFSAAKVGGKRLYELARRGEEVERKPRKIVVHEIRLERYDAARHEATIYVHCSKGTYIRSIAHELGRALGVGGHLTALRRLTSGPFRLAQAIPLDVLLDLSASGKQAELQKFLLGPREALAGLREVIVDEERARKVAFGQALGPKDLHACGAVRLEADERVRIVAGDGRFLAVGTFDRGAVRYDRVFVGPPPKA